MMQNSLSNSGPQALITVLTVLLWILLLPSLNEARAKIYSEL